MRADARRNYERLVTTAREVFTEQGPDAPLDDIARRACVGAGTLYRHFPNREALIEAVYRGEIERLSDLAYELLKDRPPEDALAEWIRAQVSWVSSIRGLLAALKGVLDKDSESYAYCKTRLREAAGGLLDAAKADGRIRPDVEAADLLRLGHGLAVAADLAPEAADRMVGIMIDGLKTGNSQKS
jgi:AcrR family transcriptional regulator